LLFSPDSILSPLGVTLDPGAPFHRSLVSPDTPHNCFPFSGGFISIPLFPQPDLMDLPFTLRTCFTWMACLPVGIFRDDISFCQGFLKWLLRFGPSPRSCWFLFPSGFGSFDFSRAHPERPCVTGHASGTPALFFQILVAFGRTPSVPPPTPFLNGRLKDVRPTFFRGPLSFAVLGAH